MAMHHRSYRLGSFGFFADSTATDGNPQSTGNFGILDQRVAMRWVQHEIAAFGGDPNSVRQLRHHFGNYFSLIISNFSARCKVWGHFV